jgi:hypothetical protein
MFNMYTNGPMLIIGFFYLAKILVKKHFRFLLQFCRDLTIESNLKKYENVCFFMRVVPLMLLLGSYLPSIDHAVSPDVSFENWVF